MHFLHWTLKNGNITSKDWIHEEIYLNFSKWCMDFFQWIFIKKSANCKKSGDFVITFEKFIFQLKALQKLMQMMAYRFFVGQSFQEIYAKNDRFIHFFASFCRCYQHFVLRFLTDIPYRLDIYELLNRPSSQTVRVEAAHSGKSQKALNVIHSTKKLVNIVNHFKAVKMT